MMEQGLQEMFSLLEVDHFMLMVCLTPGTNLTSLMMKPMNWVVDPSIMQLSVTQAVVESSEVCILNSATFS